MHDSLLDITEQNTCTYFCQLEAWTNEATACGLSVPDVASPNFTVVNETQADLQQLAVDAGEIADGVWAEAATGMFALDAVAPVYGSESRNDFLIYTYVSSYNYACYNALLHGQYTSKCCAWNKHSFCIKLSPLYFDAYAVLGHVLTAAAC